MVIQILKYKHFKSNSYTIRKVSVNNMDIQGLMKKTAVTVLPMSNIASVSMEIYHSMGATKETGRLPN